MAEETEKKAGEQANTVKWVRLVVSSDGSYLGVLDDDGKVVVESRDSGRTWQPVEKPVPLTERQHGAD